jgi:Ca-activated chloride channel family protein
MAPAYAPCPAAPGAHGADRRRGPAGRSDRAGFVTGDGDPLDGCVGLDAGARRRTVAHGRGAEAAKEFIRKQPADVQVGIVAFASAAVLVQAPTIDREALYQAINSFDLRRGTAVGSGVLVALATIFPDQNFDLDGSGNQRDQLGLPSFGGERFGTTGGADGLLSGTATEPPAKHIPVEPGSYESAVVILLTDGATTTGPDPVAAGRLAGDYGVKVFTVGFGSASGDVVDFGGRSMRAQLDSTTLQAIADATEGEYYEATSA